MSKFMSVAILAKDPSKPVVCTSTKVAKEMFIGSIHGPDVSFRKEVGLGYWTVMKDKKIVGWINMSRVVDEKFMDDDNAYRKSKGKVNV